MPLRGTKITPATKPDILLTIRFRTKSLEGFIEEYYPDVMEGGIFIRTGTSDPLLRLGARVMLRFEASNGNVLFSGRGLVAWIQGQAQRIGVGIQFEHLTARSQLVYQEMLGKKHDLARQQRLLSDGAPAREGPSGRRGAGHSGEFDEAPTLPIAPPPLFV